MSGTRHAVLGWTVAVLCLWGSAAHAQLSVQLPKFTHLDGYFGISTPISTPRENGLLYLFGVDSVFDAGRTDYFGMLLEITVGYSQYSTFGKAPFLTLQNNGEAVPFYGNLRDLPTVGVYLVPALGGGPYYGVSASYSQLTLQGFQGDTSAPKSLSATTLGFGAHLGYYFTGASDTGGPYLEAAYELRHFPGPQYAFNSGVVPGSDLASTLVMQQASIYLGWQFRLVTDPPSPDFADAFADGSTVKGPLRITNVQNDCAAGTVITFQVPPSAPGPAPMSIPVQEHIVIPQGQSYTVKTRDTAGAVVNCRVMLFGTKE